MTIELTVPNRLNKLIGFCEGMAVYSDSDSAELRKRDDFLPLGLSSWHRDVREAHKPYKCEYCGVWSEDSLGICEHCGAPKN